MKKLQWKYVKQLSDENLISKYESENKVELEEEFKDIIKKYNGGRPRPNVFDTEVRKECVFKSLVSFNNDSSASIFEVTKWVNDSTNRKLVPFASEPSGNYICFTENNNIVSWMHETGNVEFICNSFNEFLEMMYD